VQAKGLTIVPLKLFTNEKGMVRNWPLPRKKTYDKRESLKEQDTKRDLDRIKRFTTNTIKSNFGGKSTFFQT
jgi:SsrA-binding protein